MTTKYYVAHSDHVETLENQVNEKLDQGWQLQGGISVCMVRAPKAGEAIRNPDIGDAHWYTYVQALTKEG